MIGWGNLSFIQAESVSNRPSVAHVLAEIYLSVLDSAIQSLICCIDDGLLFVQRYVDDIIVLLDCNVLSTKSLVVTLTKVSSLPTHISSLISLFFPQSSICRCSGKDGAKPALLDSSIIKPGIVLSLLNASMSESCIRHVNPSLSCQCSRLHFVVCGNIIISAGALLLLGKVFYPSPFSMETF